ncbi:hypothetical protein RFN29_23985 [Mesorhizobium sp. VK22B]|uniref:Lipoprotein n=1 Tax=Mesorhizobium captivum TaxID=3072319 RepID=A0ABU4Z5W6_9HYPH|nr:hypothetical protein [Mesorhizobium sp. VK22B]MDX8494636.1 hypothetical protein [Mesorhizobium sp. VK22B]
MKAILIAAAVVGMSSVVGACSWAESLNSNCENLIVEHLLSPSSYRHIEAKRNEAPVDNVQDFIDMHGPLKSGDTALYADQFFDINKRGELLTQVTIELTYDAANIYGVLLRQRSECDFILSKSAQGDSDPKVEFYQLNVAVDVPPCIVANGRYGTRLNSVSPI